MHPFVAKLKLIYIPFLATAIGFITIYTCIDWAVFIKHDIIPLNQEVLVFWLPMILPWLPVLKWLRPRIKLLKLPENERWPFLYPMLAAFAISVPTIIVQDYLHKYYGDLVALDNIYEIAAHPHDKFYTLRDFYYDKPHTGAHVEITSGGKHNENLGLHLYFSIPIWVKREDISKKACPAWLGVEYHKTISNNMTSAERERLYDEFLRQSEEDFNQKDISFFTYLQRPGHTTAADMFLEAVKTSPKYNTYNNTILLPASEPFDERGAGKLQWSFITFGIGAFVWLIMLIPVKIHEFADDVVRRGEHLKRNDKATRETRAMFFPRPGFFISPILIYINVIIYIAMVLCGLGVVSFSAPDLLKWGANFRPLVMRGEWWRLITSMFLHGGLMHIFANMYSLLLIGMILEPLLRAPKFFCSYMACGLAASFASMWWGDTVSVGASGAIFGMFGVLLTLLLTKTVVQTFGKAMLTNLMVTIGLNLLLGFTVPGIDNRAHIGGLITGLLIGLIISFSMRLRHPGKSHPDRVP